MNGKTVLTEIFQYEAYNTLTSHFIRYIMLVAIYLFKWPIRVLQHLYALLKVCGCCSFRVDLLQTLGLPSDYLSCCCVSMASNQYVYSDLWPLTATRHIPPHDRCSLEIFPLGSHIADPESRLRCSLDELQQAVFTAPIYLNGLLPCNWLVSYSR